MLEEIVRLGWTRMPHSIPSKLVSYLRTDLLRKIVEQQEEYGVETLSKWKHLDIKKCLFSFEEPWLDLIKNDWINSAVDSFLNETAIIYDVFGLVNTDQDNHTRSQWHRDQLFLGNMRASILVMIPLVDVSSENGATQVIEGSHLIENRPSDVFMEKHKKTIHANAGDVFVMNASTWHRGGPSPNNIPRPMITIRYQLPFLKRAIDLCEIYKDELPNQEELVQRRFGWHCREMSSIEDFFTDKPKFRKGQYNTEGLYER